MRWPCPMLAYHPPSLSFERPFYHLPEFLPSLTIDVYFLYFPVFFFRPFPPLHFLLLSFASPSSGQPCSSQFSAPFELDYSQSSEHEERDLGLGLTERPSPGAQGLLHEHRLSVYATTRYRRKCPL